MASISAQGCFDERPPARALADTDLSIEGQWLRMLIAPIGGPYKLHGESGVSEMLAHDTTSKAAMRSAWDSSIPPSS